APPSRCRARRRGSRRRSGARRRRRRSRSPARRRRWRWQRRGAWEAWRRNAARDAPAVPRGAADSRVGWARGRDSRGGAPLLPTASARLGDLSQPLVSTAMVREAGRKDGQTDARDVALGLVVVCGRAGATAGRLALLPLRLAARSPVV